MPLSERIRLDAGRPFVHTLTARVLVACALVLALLLTSTKHTSSYNYNLDLSDTNKIEQTSNIKMVAQNDIYGR